MHRSYFRTGLVTPLLSAVFAVPLLVGCGSTTAPSLDQDGEDAVTQTDETTTADASVAEIESDRDGNTTEKKEAPAAIYSPEAFRDAALNGKRRVVEVCVESDLDLDESDPNGLTALAMAAYNGHDDVVKLLVAKGATIDVRDRAGNTPLIHAASGPYPSTVKLLLDSGAEINAVDSGEHFTALMMGAAMGNVEVVKVLLAEGAKTDMVDVDGDSAADFARKEGHEKIAELIDAAK